MWSRSFFISAIADSTQRAARRRERSGIFCLCHARLPQAHHLQPFYAPFLAVRRPAAPRRFTRLIQRIAIAERLAGRLTPDESRRRCHRLFVDAKGIAAEPLPAVEVVSSWDDLDESHEPFDRRNNRMRNMKANRSALRVDHVVRPAIIRRPLLLAGGLRQSLPGPVARRLLHCHPFKVLIRPWALITLRNSALLRPALESG